MLFVVSSIWTSKNVLAAVGVFGSALKISIGCVRHSTTYRRFGAVPTVVTKTPLPSGSVDSVTMLGWQSSLVQRSSQYGSIAKNRSTAGNGVIGVFGLLEWNWMVPSDWTLY